MAIVEALLKEEETRRRIKAEVKAEVKAESKQERNREIIRNMTAKNYSLATIANVLSLSEEEVQTLLTSVPDAEQAGDQ